MGLEPGWFLGTKLYKSSHKSFLDSSVGKESTCNAGDLGLILESERSSGEGIGYPPQYSWPSTCNIGDWNLIPRLGRFPGEGKGYSFHYSGLENSMDCIALGLSLSLFSQVWELIDVTHYALTVCISNMVYVEYLIYFWKSEIVKLVLSKKEDPLLCGPSMKDLCDQIPLKTRSMESLMSIPGRQHFTILSQLLARGIKQVLCDCTGIRLLETWAWIPLDIPAIHIFPLLTLLCTLLLW